MRACAPAQVGLYLGALLATFNTAMHVTRNSKGSAAYYRGAIAGAIAGASLHFAPQKTRGARARFSRPAPVRTLVVIRTHLISTRARPDTLWPAACPVPEGYVALLVAVRAAEVAARNHARKHEGSVPRAVSANGDVLLMCLASAPVLYCWIFAPEALEPNYLRFLNRQSGKDDSVLRAVAACYRKDMVRADGVSQSAQRSFARWNGSSGPGVQARMRRGD